jgi:thioredoxin reductase (NADPH)
LIEKYIVGGQAGTSSRIENYLGFPKGISGADLVEAARERACRFGAEILMLREGVHGAFQAEKNTGYLKRWDKDYRARDHLRYGCCVPASESS